MPQEATKPKEAVNHPSHYQAQSGGLEVIDVIRAFVLNFWLGNVVKYVLRAGKKGQGQLVEDLKKARWYLDDYIRGLEAEEARVLLRAEARLLARGRRRKKKP